MKKQQKRSFLLVLILVFLVLIACTNIEGSFLLGTLCETRGGTWREELNRETFELREWCEPKSTPPTVPVEDNVFDIFRSCIVPEDSYSWSYEDYNSSSGTGGVTCRARFLFKNTSDKPVRLYLYTSWDNNTMNFTGWDQYSVQPESEWEKPVNHTIYSTAGGGVTFDRVNRMVVLWDSEECRVGPGDIGEVPEDLDEWLDATPILNDIPCP